MIKIILFVLLFAGCVALWFNFSDVRNYVGYLGAVIVFSFLSYAITSIVHNNLPNKLFGKVNPKDKAILVTGSARGFGRKFALKLNKLGFRVYATCRSVSETSIVDFKNAATHPDEFVVVKLDITQEDEINTALNFIRADLIATNRVLWGLVNNAGVNDAGGVEWGDYQDSIGKCLEINLASTIKVTRAFLPLIRRASGRVVNISSLAGKVAFPNYAGYTMSKAALNMFSETLRREVRSFGVKVIVISPSFYGTEIMHPDKVINEIRASWIKSDEEVLEFYGNEYFEDTMHLYRMVYGSNFFVEPNFSKVVSAVVDGLITRNPQLEYICAPLRALPILWIMKNLPDEIMNYMFFLAYRPCVKFGHFMRLRAMKKTGSGASRV